MKWTSDLAYVVGLIAADGNLSNDGRHLILVSKDLEQLDNFSRILGIRSVVKTKKSGYTGKSDNYFLQFSDVKFYRFLISLGLTPNKSKNLGKLDIPDKYFVDFVRGCLDGDGFTYSYWDKRWKSSFMFYSGLTSASPKFLEWVKNKISELFGIEGVVKSSGNSGYQLVYAKKSSMNLMKKLYYYDKITCLSRKKIKIEKALSIINQQSRSAEMVDRHA
jgi:hypothetical protein